MKNKRAIPILALTAALMLIFSGCSEYSDFGVDFYAGETITPAQIAAISAGIASDKEDSASSPQKTTAAKTARAPSETDPEGNIIVYWTAGGGVWHLDRDCGSLSNSSAILSGSIKEAEAAGKDRACKKCGSEYAESTG